MRKGRDGDAAHRPQIARATLHHSLTHGKRQTRLAAAASARANHRARAQRVVEVGRVHLRALVRRACAQPSQRIALAAPRVGQGAISGTVLQADRVEAVVESHHVCCA